MLASRSPTGQPLTALPAGNKHPRASVVASEGTARQTALVNLRLESRGTGMLEAQLDFLVGEAVLEGPLKRFGGRDTQILGDDSPEYRVAEQKASVHEGSVGKFRPPAIIDYDFRRTLFSHFLPLLRFRTAECRTCGFSYLLLRQTPQAGSNPP